MPALPAWADILEDWNPPDFPPQPRRPNVSTSQVITTDPGSTPADRRATGSYAWLTQDVGLSRPYSSGRPVIWTQSKETLADLDDAAVPPRSISHRDHAETQTVVL